MMDYTAIDFETANAKRGSPCSVGLVRVRNGVAVEAQHWLIRPPQGLDYFSPINVGVHHITAEMVADQPRWRKRLPDIVDFIGGDVVVAHNASFDISVIRGACDADGVPWPELNYLCTWVMSKRVLQLPSYTLPFVLRELGSSIADHHNALADAHGVVEVISGLSNRSGGVNDLQTLAQTLGVSPGAVRCDRYWGCTARGY